jgi:hypothetical protein
MKGIVPIPSARAVEFQGEDSFEIVVDDIRRSGRAIGRPDSDLKGVRGRAHTPLSEPQ